MSFKTKTLVIAALLLIPLIYFYPVLLGNVFLAPGDGWAQNFGVRALAGKMIASGQAPLWNPFIFGGMPLMAGVYPGSFYPPNWLFAVLPPATAMNIVVLSTYHIALVGTYLYARRLGVTRAGALIAGIAFAFGGFMINHLSHTSRIAAAAWLPWVLLAIENLNVESRWKWAALGALFIALQFFAGEPQMMLFTALVCAPNAICIFLKNDERASRRGFIGAISLMLVGGLLLCLLQLLPSLELLAQSERSDPGPAFFDTYSLPPWQLPALIFPYFFGGSMFPPYKVDYWGAEIPAIMSGYVGMLVWILAFAAIFAGKRQGRVWLWLGIAVVSILLAFGGHLPFELNHKLYKIPGYKTFRGLYRHQFEFTFAMGMLAGLGMTALSQIDKERVKKLLLRATVAMSVVVVLIAALYRFYGDALATVKPRPIDAASLTNAEFIVPVIFFVISLVLLWIAAYGLRRSILTWLLPVVLLIDVASYGHFFHWPIAKFDVDARLADPPALQLIKSREVDLNSFRVMSYPVQAYDYAYAWPEDPNFDLLNQPNASIFRGVQSISGYDILRPARVGEITGTAGSALNGFVQDANSFSPADRGFDLLNVKYLIVGNGGATNKKTGFTYDGVYFPRTNFGVKFEKGVRVTTEPGGAWATEIAVVSTMANSTHLPDGAPILKFRLHAKDGRVIDRDLLAGRDTSEWAYDAPEVRANIKHAQAKIVESQDAEKIQSHSYLGRVKFDRAEIEKIEWIYAREDAVLYLVRASLHDETSGVSTPLANFYLPPERWRKLARFDQIDVFENLQTMPRAWFVREAKKLSPPEALKIIRTGVMPGGEKFDPAKIALTEDDAPQIDASASGEQPKIVRYEPNRIEFETHRTGAGFLVVSEIFFDGWMAFVDGREVQIQRVDYVLRGIYAPAGDHRIIFEYRPRSFRNGLIAFAAGLTLLGVALAIGRRGKTRNTPN